MRTRAQAVDPVAVDVPYLAASFGVTESALQTILDEPTAQLVKDFLQTITIKSQEFDSLKSEKLKLDVELENVVRTSDTKIKAQKAAVTRQNKEIEELKNKLNEAGAARENLVSELDQLRSSSSGSTLETQSLRQRIESLEASNRDALALVENKSTEKDRIANELSEQHSKLLTLRREINSLEDRNRTLESAAVSQKSKEQTLQQEIDYLKRTNEWNTTELETRAQEQTKFRKDRNARIATLQRELEDATANVDALKRTETTLRNRLSELQAKADDALSRIASLQDDAARKEHALKNEVEGTKRLAELQGQNAATHRKRLQEVQAEIEQLKEDAAVEIGTLQAEIETERADREEAQQRVTELELAVERLEQQPRYSRPATPMGNGPLIPSTPGRPGAGSPSALSGSMRKSVGQLSYSKLVSDYNQCRQELSEERLRTEKLSEAVDGLINDLESQKPVIEEFQSEQLRLEKEIIDATQLVDQANDIRDKAVEEAQHWHGETEAAKSEGQILRQQLRDLSAQIKILLVEIQSRDQGLAELSADERLELERAARGELNDADLDDMSSTGRLISERLVLFRDVSDLQAQNEKLLRLTRELGEQMEGEEAREKSRQSAADAQELDHLRQQVGRYKDELNATATQIESYMKERDMFRRMLQHRGQLPPNADTQAMFGQSIAPATPSRSNMEPPATPRSKDIEDVHKLLKEQQIFFDQYRQESSTDRRQLKEQVDGLSVDKSQLQLDLTRAQSQLTLASERYDMLQSSYNGLRNENSEIQKRANQFSESAAKQDLRIQQTAEDLAEARSMTDSLRHENANAKAERELWKRIEARLTEDNKVLVDDRSRLNKLVNDLQNLQNERELAESEIRRRLEGRLEDVGSELSETKKKLEVELEDSKKASLRREFEENQSRTRIDDLVKSLGQAREELVAATTTRDQLQSRVDELKIELHSAEEKVVALQPRPTPRAPAQRADEEAAGSSEELQTEQKLALEISDLRRDLEFYKVELERSKEANEHYRAISQAAEDDLASFTETAEQFKEESERVLEEKEAKIKELEQRIEDINAELTTTNNELSELRTTTEDSNRLLAEQKVSFDVEINRLKDDAERYAEERKLYQADLKTQAEIAQQAQQSYETELIKHAEAATSLQTVRKEYNDLRTQVATIKAESDAAKASLEQSEDSWSEQRERFEREIEDMKRRRQDVDDQNKLLHKQMDNFATELEALRQARPKASFAVADDDDNASAPVPSNSNNLQEVIRYLRREKDIVDVQYELRIQEASRLQQQLDYANTQLEDTREKLAEERRQSMKRDNAEGSATKLLQTINELNLFRESSVTLRNEAKQAREKLEDKSKEVERLLADIEPMKGRIFELEGEVEMSQGEKKLLEDDRNHWRERTQNIISKYDRVDPAELEELKRQLAELTTEKERLESEQGPLQEKIETFDSQLAEERAAAAQDTSERLQKMRAQAKEQDKKRMERIRELSDRGDSMTAEIAKLNADLAAATSELEQVNVDLQQTRESLAAAEAANQEEGQVQETEETEDHAALHARIAEAEANASGHASRADDLSLRVQTLQNNVQELELRISTLQQSLEASDSTNTVANPTEETRNSDQLRQEIASLQQEVETLRNNVATSSTSDQATKTADSGPVEISVAEQVATEVAKLRSEMEQQHELAIKQMEETHAQRVENLKNGLKRQLREVEKPKLRQEIEAALATEHAVELQRLKSEHEAAIAKLKQDYSMEIERLTQEGGAAVAKADTAANVKSESIASEDLTEAHLREAMKTNPSVKAFLQNHVRSNVERQTEKLKATIAEKDAEVTRLTLALENAPTGEAEVEGAVSRQELVDQLEAAKKEKEVAVRQAVAKTKVQLNQRDILQAKVAVVKKAVAETPEKSVKEVWEVADKAKPAPKPTPAPTEPPLPSPVTAQPTIPEPPVQSTPVAVAQTPEQIEAAKMMARQARFGAASLEQPIPQPAAPPVFVNPNQTGTPRQPIGVNPQAPEFTPGGDANTVPSSALPKVQPQSSIPQPGGNAASKLPRIPGARQSSFGGPPGQQGNNLQGGGRGGMQSGLPRGGGNRGGRGGGGGGGGRGGANAGQKRQHDGGDGGGDGKRMRNGSGPDPSGV